ncbi:MAG: hypothetical protein IJG08_06180, partial [Oscillospiraceae bacterium]|nr:hypothetical protein [Oscillospiraceae bacterium]
MTEEGEPDRQQTAKPFAHPPHLRSFPHHAPATFSLSGRPCGRHPPPLGIGVKLTITGDFKQSKQQKQAKSKDVFALKKHKTNEAFQVKKSSYQ